MSFLDNGKVSSDLVVSLKEPCPFVGTFNSILAFLLSHLLLSPFVLQVWLSMEMLTVLCAKDLTK